jgi:putative transposase
MARHLRVEFPGAIYHVTCRMLGDRRSVLFRDDNDRDRLLERLAGGVEQYGVRLYLYVLMTNHFHLVFETPEANCSRFMHSLLTAYTVYFNLRHDRHGHLLDGRFKSRIVDGDDYLLALTRYVHLNPVSVRSNKNKPIDARIQCLQEYRWSSYPEYIGRRKEQGIVSFGPMLAEMATTERTSLAVRRRRYREFVETGLAEDDAELRQAMGASPRSIGGREFRSWIDQMYCELAEKSESAEDVSFRHVTEPQTADEVLTVLGSAFQVEVDEFRRRQRNSPLRAIAARYLMRYAGLSQRAVAQLLGAGSGSAISKQLRRHTESLEKDRKLKRAMHKADKMLTELRKKR